MSIHRNPSRNVINFAAGPSAIPFEVLEIAKRELVDYQNHGVSIMELSHRSAAFAKIMTRAEKDVRNLINIPDNYKVIFTQGGGNGQFSAIPMNLIARKEKRKADYFVTGYWSDRAYKEAQKYGDINLVLPKTDKYYGIK
jgi:phosphoserine aminotransferase